MQRGGCVTHCPCQRREVPADVFQFADILLLDEDDMVQKGYCWMLKVASQTHRKEVFEYVFAHKTTLPRTAPRLRH